MGGSKGVKQHSGWSVYASAVSVAAGPGSKETRRAAHQYRRTCDGKLRRRFFRKPEPLDVKRLGWSEMKHGIAFGILLAISVIPSESLNKVFHQANFT